MARARPLLPITGSFGRAQVSMILLRRWLHAVSVPIGS